MIFLLSVLITILALTRGALVKIWLLDPVVFSVSELALKLLIFLLVTEEDQLFNLVDEVGNALALVLKFRPFLFQVGHRLYVLLFLASEHRGCPFAFKFSKLLLSTLLASCLQLRLELEKGIKMCTALEDAYEVEPLACMLEANSSLASI